MDKLMLTDKPRQEETREKTARERGQESQGRKTKQSTTFLKFWHCILPVRAAAPRRPYWYFLDEESAHKSDLSNPWPHTWARLSTTVPAIPYKTRNDPRFSWGSRLQAQTKRTKYHQIYIYYRYIPEIDYNGTMRVKSQLIFPPGYIRFLSLNTSVRE